MRHRHANSKRDRAPFRRGAWRGLLLTLAAATVGLTAWSFSSERLSPESAGRPELVREASAPIDRLKQTAPRAVPVVETASTKSAAVEALAPTPPPLSPARPRWLENAVLATPANDRPMIAIVIDDMGLDRRRSARVLELPGPLTTAFLPYAQDLPAQTRDARRKGHELLVHVPMEAADRSANPGPNALLVSLPAAEVLRRLHADLAAFDGYVGINNHMGSRFTGDRSAMTLVLEELKSRGLLFLDSRTGPSVGADIARSINLPHAARDVFIDHDTSPQAVSDSLRRLEVVARRTGHAVGIGHPKDETLNQLTRWLPSLEGKGFALVPVSAIVRASRPDSETRVARSSGRP